MRLDPVQLTTTMNLMTKTHSSSEPPRSSHTMARTSTISSISGDVIEYTTNSYSPVPPLVSSPSITIPSTPYTSDEEPIIKTCQITTRNNETTHHKNEIIINVLGGDNEILNQSIISTTHDKEQREKEKEKDDEDEDMSEILQYIANTNTKSYQDIVLPKWDYPVKQDNDAKLCRNIATQKWNYQIQRRNDVK